MELICHERRSLEQYLVEEDPQWSYIILVTFPQLYNDNNRCQKCIYETLKVIETCKGTMLVLSSHI